MHPGSDNFAKGLLRDALSRAGIAETEVEVIAATQRIDVYCIPDPARAAERTELGLLGDLSVDASLFECFHNTPGLGVCRRCLNKQLTWHHELERRARSAGSTEGEPVPPSGTGEEDPAKPLVPFPALVIVSTGRPETILDAFGCRESRPGVYEAVWGLKLRIVVLSELPRTRETLILRLLGKGRVLREALADLAALPAGTWEQSVASPLLLHFQMTAGERPEQEEDVSAEIQAWYQEYQQRQRESQEQAVKEGRLEGAKEGRLEGERGFLVELLRDRFGELPASVSARIDAAESSDVKRWGKRALAAQTLTDVFENLH